MDILEKFASLTLNSQAGVFITLMVIAARKNTKGDNIPLPIADWFWHLIWLVPLFFNAAVVMDVYDTVIDILDPMSIQPVNITFYPNGTAVSSTGFTVSSDISSLGLDDLVDKPS